MLAAPSGLDSDSEVEKMLAVVALMLPPPSGLDSASEVEKMLESRLALPFRTPPNMSSRLPAARIHRRRGRHRHGRERLCCQRHRSFPTAGVSAADS